MDNWGGGEGQVHICVQSMCQTMGVRGHAPLENVDFGPSIRHTLVESRHKHNLPFIKGFIIDLHVK